MLLRQFLSYEYSQKDFHRFQSQPTLRRNMSPPSSWLKSTGPHDIISHKTKLFKHFSSLKNYFIHARNCEGEKDFQNHVCNCRYSISIDPKILLMTRPKFRSDASVIYLFHKFPFVNKQNIEVSPSYITAFIWSPWKKYVLTFCS
jgi:hypothetical protein